MKNFHPIIKKIGSGRPTIAVIGCLHGDELVGKKIIDELNKLKIIKGSLLTIIANRPAMKRKKRFVDVDLNRSFQNRDKNKIEVKIANLLKPHLKTTDFVIDIHSASYSAKPMVIVKKKNQKIKKLINIIKPNHVVFMNQGIGDSSLINYCQAGVSLEYGSHNSSKTFNKTLVDIKKILSDFGFLNKKVSPDNKKIKTEYYQVYGFNERPENFVKNKKIKDFQLIKKGDLLGTANGQKILAKENFYAVLFGENSYSRIIGFKAKKMKKF